MLLEKPLLHALLTIVPICIYGFLFAKSKIAESPTFIGLLNGVTASLCLLFPFQSYQVYWDIRSVPLVIACIYGGPISGVIVVVMLLITRTYLGGEALYYGYFAILLSAVVPLLLSKKYLNVKSRTRVIGAIWSAVWAGAMMLLILIAYIYLQDQTGLHNRGTGKDVILTIAMYILGYFFAIMLSEIVLERKQMQAEIARAEKLKTLGEIAASIAHEVRNPLTVVKGFLQLMAEKKDERTSPYLPLVLSELERAETIITEYLSFAKPHLQKVERFLLEPLLTNALFLLEPLALKEGIELEGQFKDNPSVSGDRSQLQQVIMNLTKNAIEATPSGGRVTLKIYTREDWVYIIISDTGKGMSREHLKRLGTLFYSTKDKGTGLGTTVSWQIIRNMNGNITYDSELDVGTEVKITLPAKKECISKGAINDGIGL